MNKQDIITEGINGFTWFAVIATAATADEAFRTVADDNRYAPANESYLVTPALDSEYLVDDAWRLHNTLNHFIMFRGDETMMRIPISSDHFPYEAHAQQLWYRLVETVGQETAENMAKALGSRSTVLIVPIHMDPWNPDASEWLIAGYGHL